ncbi:MAG: transposase [Alphaproteobacteria bacterium]|nr:transposase [Alphaproteobacteria bacterium]
MKRKRFSTEQIVSALKQVELGLPVADLIRQLGISEQTYYRWKKSYAGLESDQVRELRQVVDENTRLKKLVAELSLDKAVLQDVLSKKFPGRRS